MINAMILLLNVPISQIWVEWLFLAGSFIWHYWPYKQRSPKYESAKCSFEFSSTISNKWTHIFSTLVHVFASINQRFNGRVCFHVEKATSLKEALSPYLCFISFLYLDLYVFGDGALISRWSFMQTKHLCVLIHI